MTRKIEWEISLEGYGPQYTVVAPTRTLAIGVAEARWSEQTADYRHACVDDDGTVIPALEMPTYTARKIGRALA